jgi:hypothetical protein
LKIGIAFGGNTPAYNNLTVAANQGIICVSSAHVNGEDVVYFFHNNAFFKRGPFVCYNRWQAGPVFLTNKPFPVIYYS